MDLTYTARQSISYLALASDVVTFCNKSFDCKQTQNRNRFARTRKNINPFVTQWTNNLSFFLEKDGKLEYENLEKFNLESCWCGCGGMITGDAVIGDSRSSYSMLPDTLLFFLHGEVSSTMTSAYFILLSWRPSLFVVFAGLNKKQNQDGKLLFWA